MAHFHARGILGISRISGVSAGTAEMVISMWSDVLQEASRGLAMQSQGSKRAEVETPELREVQV